MTDAASLLFWGAVIAVLLSTLSGSVAWVRALRTRGRDRALYVVAGIVAFATAVLIVLFYNYNLSAAVQH